MRILSGFICLFVWAVSLSASEDSLFLEANELYQQESFEEALDRYREITRSGYASAELYYNMGNAAFRSNHIGYAILYYEKALKLDPSHADARHNLEYVSRYRTDVFDEVPDLFLRNWVRSLAGLFGETTWSVLALLFFALVPAGILIYLFSRSLGSKKAGFFLAPAGLVLFVISFSAALKQHRRTVDPEEGIIVGTSVVVRSTPSNGGNELFILHEGTKADLNEEVTGWQNIRVPDGREGWIPSTEIESI